MAADAMTAGEPAVEELQEVLKDIEYSGRKHSPRVATIVAVIAAVWSLYQLWIASPLPFMLDFGIFTDVPARGIHLAFGMLLVYLVFPSSRKAAKGSIPVTDVVFAIVGCLCAFYLYVGWSGLTQRVGVPLSIPVSLVGYHFDFPFDVVLGWCGILLLLEATRRAIGWPLVIVATIFILYSIFGRSMPELISHRGVSLSRLAGYQWLTGEAIFGIPISVTTNFVFLFVLFGAILETAGAGRFFLDLAFSLVGRYTGGPAKATILSSGLMGMISGSSVANVVTCGTFTIPAMRKMGMPAIKAGAIEVAAGVDGQIMPPVMGAAAFIIAEFVGITYREVCIAAFAPAVMSYIALFYISHLESVKLGLRGLPESEVPRFLPTLISGLHFIVPVAMLIYLLLWENWSPESSVFYSILLMFGIILWQNVNHARRSSGSLVVGFAAGLHAIFGGLVKGARNMVSITMAVAAAGIIVGSVSSTGLNNALVSVVEVVAGGNLYVLLAMVAILSLVLGMGLPTTANYVVVASLLAGVMVEVGNAAGLVLPLIAVHLYVFYFGLMADVTPPVCLAAFAAAAISRADPLKTGVQAFYYSIRTAILPLVFLFNTELLMIGITSFWHGLVVFVCSLLAILAFSSIAMGWMFTRLKIWEYVVLAVVVMGLFRPGVVLNQFYPDFEAIDLNRLVAGDIQIESGRDVRFHITRQTDYGERYKLFRLSAPEGAKGDVQHVFGITLERDVAGNFRVDDVALNGLAGNKGIAPKDLVTASDAENLNRPSKLLVYPFMLLLLGVVVAAQFFVRRRQKRGAAMADAAV